MEEYTRKARDLLYQSTSPKEWENVHEQKPPKRAKSQERAMRDERWEVQAPYHREKKEKPNPTNVTKDSYYVILAPKHHSFDNLWILPADMDNTKEKGGTVLHPRMFEERAAAYQVEGGNLAERVLCLLRGVSLTPGSVTGGSDWSLRQRRGSNDSRKHQCVSSVGASWTLFWETLT